MAAGLRFDEDQRRAFQVIRQAVDHGGAHVLLFGPGGSGKSAVALKALEGRLGFRCAVATAQAQRFGGTDGLNTQELLHVVKQQVKPQKHRYVESNATCRSIFGPRGAFVQGKRFYIAIDEAGQMSGEHALQIVDAVWKLCLSTPRALTQMSKIAFLFIGDPERQLPNISGTELLKSQIFFSHPSGFAERVWCGLLKGRHRFDPSCRDVIEHIEFCFAKYDRLLLKTVVDQAKQRYRAALEKDDIYSMLHFVATRAEAERYLLQAAAHHFGEDFTTACSRPPDWRSDKEKSGSHYTAASFTFATCPSVTALVETTVSGKSLVATSCNNPEISVPVANRTRFSIGPDAISDLPEVFPSGKSECTVSVYINEVGDCVMPMFTFDKAGNSQPVFRQLGWSVADADTGEDRVLTAVRLLFNAQGEQFQNEKIVIGSDKCSAPISGTFAYVALTRCKNPANVHFHDALNVEFLAKDEKRRAETRRLVKSFASGSHRKSPARAAPPQKKRRLSCHLPPMKPGASS